MSEVPIKSVRRIFEILELFDQERRPLAAKEIADRLEYPLMSAHALLKSMHHLGYADFDAPKWTYTPSRGFLDVLDWTRDFLDRETDLLDFVSALNRETLETINLSRRVSTQVKILHGLETLQPVGVSVKVGTEMPASQSLTGLTALACLSKSDLEQFLKRLKKSDSKQARILNRRLLSDVAAELEKYGTVSRTDVFVEGIGAVCLPVRAKTTGEILVIGVVGPSDRVRQKDRQHRRILKRLAADFNVETCWKLKTPTG